MTVVCIGVLGSMYAIFGGLKLWQYLIRYQRDTAFWHWWNTGTVLALYSIGDGNIFNGLTKVFPNAPEKFNVIGAKDSVMPFRGIFTGLIINQLYFWGMNQTIIQRALGAKNLKEAQRGLLLPAF
jgi:solute:Na+ symporter, SSS family